MTASTHARAREVTDEERLIQATAYARELAFSLWNQHWHHTAPGWKPLDDLYGLLTQIDNMTCGMIRGSDA